MMDTDDLIARYIGHDVPVSFSPAFIIVSYVVSLLGAGSTLELINRRTSSKGIHNHLMLVGAAITMGGIAIWAMHFIAYRAIILLDGKEYVQIAYAPGFTTLSFFVPILVLLLAFIAVGSHNGVKWWRVVLAGALSGGAICGMHYLGDHSISNYRCHYDIANIIGAAAIAVTAATVALSLFFKFRAAWTNSWIRRLGCTVLMSSAAAGMHWCASLGTHYTMLDTAANAVGSTSQNTTTIIVVCLAVGASIIMVTTAIITARKLRGYALKAQQMVLAAAVFDKHGRILVSPDGLLPSERVTETFPQRSYDDVFSTAHPLFHWMFRASRNWSSIATLLPWMSEHVQQLPGNSARGRAGTRLIEDNGQLVQNYDIIFRELFCLAASSLASKMGEEITNLGVLWDEIFHTGNEIKSAVRMSKAFDVAVQKDMFDISQLEQGDGYGRGSLMFVVRHVHDAAEVSKLEAAGYRFAHTDHVADIIGTSMQIKSHHLQAKLRDMAEHSELDSTLVPRVHVALFAVRARLDKYGFDVLVHRNTRNGLPTVELPCRQLESWQEEVLAQVDGLPLQTLLIRLVMMPADSPPRQIQFAAQLRAAIAKLRADLGDAAIDKATLSARPVQMPCLAFNNSARSSTTTPTCTVITLQVVLDINTRVQSTSCDFIPLQFFKVRQLVANNSSHQAAFSRILHRDLASVMVAARPSTSPQASNHSHGSSTTNLCPEPQFEDKDADPCSGRVSPAFEVQPFPSFEATTNKNPNAAVHGRKPSPFGGIMVSTDIAIHIDEVKQPEKTPSPKITSSLQSPRSPTSPRNAPPRTPNTGTQGRSRAGTRGIELDRMDSARPQTSGGGVFSRSGGLGRINVEATETDEDVTTFVDELFASCIERRG